MKKVFISQPMNGLTDAEILLEREKAITECEIALHEKVELIDSFCNEDLTPLGYLAYSIKCLADADAAYFAKGWQDARGCLIEQRCASDYGIPCIFSEFDPHKTTIGKRLDAGLWD